MCGLLHSQLASNAKEKHGAQIPAAPASLILSEGANLIATWSEMSPLKPEPQGPWARYFCLRLPLCPFSRVLRLPPEADGLTR